MTRKRLILIALLPSLCMADTVTLSLTAARDKYGVVTVFNSNRTFNREFKITGAELSTLQKSTNGIPPNVTKSEWESGLAVVNGKGLDVGDIEANGRHLTIKFAESVLGGRFVESYLQLESSEWSGTLPNITVSTQTLTAIKDDPNPDTKRIRMSGKVVNSITNGVLDYIP